MNNFLAFFSGIIAFACLVGGIIIASKPDPNYGEANFYLLLAVFNYITSIDNFNHKDD